MSTPEDEQAEAAFELWNEGTADHIDVTTETSATDALDKILVESIVVGSLPLNEAREALLAWRDEAILAELEELKQQTTETTQPEAFVTDAGAAQSIRIHTNSLIEHRLAELKSKQGGTDE